MKLYHIVAMASGRVIGKDNKLPWHFSSDLKYFKQFTTGSTVIMGRKTFESIGRPLLNRENFVLSRSMPSPYPLPQGEGNKKKSLPEVKKISLSPTGRGQGEGRVRFFPSLDAALQNVRTPKAFIIGGADLYRQTIELVDGIYLTQIHGDYQGDTYYPLLPPGFSEKSRTKLQQEPLVEMVFYERG